MGKFTILNWGINNEFSWKTAEEMVDEIVRQFKVMKKALKGTIKDDELDDINKWPETIEVKEDGGTKIYQIQNNVLKSVQIQQSRKWFYLE